MTQKTRYLLVSTSILALTTLCWPQAKIDQGSVTSLRLTVMSGEKEIATATGFVMEKNNKHYLITNRHVVLLCNQDQDPNNVGGWICATHLAILQNKEGRLGQWIRVIEDLYSGPGHDKRWLEHPTLHGAVDIVALPLTHIEDVQFYPVDPGMMNEDMSVLPGDPVAIVGFPLGLVQSGGLPIWKTGTVASDPDMDYEGKRMFAVDTTSRPGMSGSPVYAVRSGTYRSKAGTLMVPLAAGSSVKRMLGVYSEQILVAEIGGVWKAEVLKELYDSLP